MDLIKFLAILAVFILLDFVWIGFVAKGFYKTEISKFYDSDKINFIAGFLVYLLLAIGIYFFVGSVNYTTSKTILMAALFGLVVYGVYDLTNKTIIQEYSLKLIIVDILWGMISCSIVAYIQKFF